MSKRDCQSSILIVAKLISHSGDSIFLFPLLIIISLFNINQLARHTWPIVAGMVATAVIVWLIKITVRKDRPKGSHGKLYRKTDPYSFPSGHAARVFTIVGISLFDTGLFIVLVIMWALSVTISRIVLKLHYWNDVLVGSALGLLVGIVIHYIFQDLW